MARTREVRSAIIFDFTEIYENREEYFRVTFRKDTFSLKF